MQVRLNTSTVMKLHEVNKILANKIVRWFSFYFNSNPNDCFYWQNADRKMLQIWHFSCYCIVLRCACHSKITREARCKKQHVVVIKYILNWINIYIKCIHCCRVSIIIINSWFQKLIKKLNTWSTCWIIGLFWYIVPRENSERQLCWCQIIQ